MQAITSRRRSARASLRLSGQYGSFELVEPDGREMVALRGAMAADNSDLCWNWPTALNQWKAGALLVAALAETHAMDERRVGDIFLAGGGGGRWLLPAFVSANEVGGPIKLLWVTSRLRRRGLASAMVRLGPFALPLPRDVLPSAAPFWRAVAGGAAKSVLLSLISK